MTGLTDAEREALHAPSVCDCDELLHCRTLATTYGEVERILAERDAAWAAKIEALHHPDSTGDWCDHCWTGPDSHGNGPSPAWPCETIRALLSADDTEALDPRVCTDPDCTIKPKPGRPMHGPHDFRARADRLGDTEAHVCDGGCRR